MARDVAAGSKRRLPGNLGFIGLCIAAVLAAAAVFPGSRDGHTLSGEGWVPNTPGTVVLQLSAGDPVIELAGLRERLDRYPHDADAAARYGSQAMQHFARTGDARFVGYAEGAIGFWRDDPDPPQSIWLLRGRILQTQHRFLAAAEDLERMLERYPHSPEAMLLAADAWRRAGALRKAKMQCEQLAGAGHGGLASFCIADILMSLGDAEGALQAAAAGARSAGNGTEAVAQWALAVMGDAAAAAGRLPLAESYYREALTLPDAGIALHVAYADLLLRDDRPQEAVELLGALPDADAVVLRRAIAASRLKSPQLGSLRAALERRFQEAQLLGAGSLHLRERAMFALQVEGDAAAAVALALDNWALQKGPEDAALLVEAAEAAEMPGAARRVSAWRRSF